MRKGLLIFIITIVLISLIPSCNLDTIDENSSINHNIFPYVKFTPSEDGTYYTASILEGASVANVYIPSYAYDKPQDENTLPVLEFTGFESSDDIVNLISLIIESSNTTIEKGSLDKAINLEKINIIGANDDEGVSKLQNLTADGKHFHEWKITEDGARAVMYELIHHEVNDPTCTEDGNIEYWECPDCGKLFLDSTAKEETTEGNVIIKALGHKFPLKKVEESESSCSTHGNKEHWYCERCGQRFWDSEGTQKATADEVTKPFVHVWDEGWQTDEEYHWHVCEKGCGATTEKEKHDDGMNYNTKYHWYECSKCGKRLSGSEVHTFDEKGEYCTKCGYVYDNTDSNPGFDVEPVYQDPTGEISSSYDKTLNKWTFTLIATNLESLPTGWEWYVDGKAVEGADSATFEFIPPSEESYVIFCMFWNDKGAGSSEVNI